jgi:CHAP domain
MRLMGRYVASLAAVAAVLAGTTPASASPSDTPVYGYGPDNAGWSDYYSSPGNTATWNAFCADAGATEVTVRSLPVPACGPTGSNNIDIPYGYPYQTSEETYTPGFQCVELTDRYMYATRHWGAVGGDGADVVRVYGAAHHIAPVLNGSPGQAPRVGDVISFSVESGFTDDSDFYPGHTAIVSASSVDPAGNGSVTILSENFSGTAETTQLDVSSWSIQPIESANADDGLVNTPYIEWLPLGRPDAGAGAGTATATTTARRSTPTSRIPSTSTSTSTSTRTPAPSAAPAASADPGLGLLSGLASTASPAITGLSGGAWQVAYPAAGQ